MARELVGSVTKDDCVWQTFRAGGPGGQSQNKTDSAARCTHPPSGAAGESREHKSQLQNKRAAFRRMAESKEFQLWARRQASGLLSIEAEVEKQMRPSNLRVEVRQEGKWIEDKDVNPTR